MEEEEEESSPEEKRWREGGREAMGGPIIRMLSAARNFHLPEEAGEVSPPFGGLFEKKETPLGFCCVFVF